MVTATGGLDALAIMEGDQGFDAVLCDLMMPDCDGVAVQESLEAAGSPLASRMLFFSGGVFTDRVRGFIRERKHRFLEKPVEIEALLAAVDALVDETTR